jgi:hypothetical protein
MARKMFPFLRHDGIHELAVLGNFGLGYAYSSTEKDDHYVEDVEADRDSVDPDSYYIQMDDSYTLSEYKSKGIHLIRNIDDSGEQATYEYFAASHDSDDQDDWIEEKCPSSDFTYLLNSEMLIPMKKVEYINK